MRTRSILSNLCFAAGALFVLLTCGGVVSLSFPGGGFVPLLGFTGMVWLCYYLRTRVPSFRSIAPATLLDWLLAIPVASGVLLGYVCHVLWLEVLALVVGVTHQFYRDSVSICAYNATHPA